jgi:hypothetical protein
MRETQWIEWTRTRLQPREREELLTALGPEQKAHWAEHDYVWVKGIGVLWNPPDGALRRARFTHGAHFQTQRGEFPVHTRSPLPDAAWGVLRRLRGQRARALESKNRCSRACGAPAEAFRGQRRSRRRDPPSRSRLAPGECVEQRTQKLVG